MTPLKITISMITLLITALVLYFALWPVPFEPQVWQAPPNPGLTGAFAPNQKLAKAQQISLGDYHGPEGMTLDAEGRLYLATATGHILRMKNSQSPPEVWAQTDGRPQGMAFAPNGHLIVADSHRGLLSISPEKKITLLTNEAEAVPIVYANDLDVATDGTVYFSDASTKFGSKAFGTFEGFLLDFLEQGDHGRLLAYSPQTKQTRVLVKNLNFPNGVAVTPDQSAVLFAETSRYRISKYGLSGPKQGQTEVILDALPSFPDNIARGQDGRFWVALNAPRNAMVDGLANAPFWRKVIYRIPTFLQPKAEEYGHVIAIDQNGKVLENLQAPNGEVAKLTSVIEGKEALYMGNLHAPYFELLEGWQ